MRSHKSIWFQPDSPAQKTSELQYRSSSRYPDLALSFDSRNGCRAKTYSCRLWFVAPWTPGYSLTPKSWVASRHQFPRSNEGCRREPGARCGRIIRSTPSRQSRVCARITEATEQAVPYPSRIDGNTIARTKIYCNTRKGKCLLHKGRISEPG
jgi:hypothetical protein